jgi:hypothetical protein
MDENWNVGRVGNEVTCNFFRPEDKSKPGHDLRSMDYQFARITGEPSYIEVLREFYDTGRDKCDEQFEKSDLIKHKEENRNILWERTNGKLANLGFTMGVETETKAGSPLAPTCIIIILEQMKNSICSDRFFFSHADDLFNEGKIRIYFRFLMFLIKNFFKAQKSGINEFDVRDLLCATNKACKDTKIQENPFTSPGKDNTKKSCDEPEVHLSKLNLDEYLKKY